MKTYTGSLPSLTVTRNGLPGRVDYRYRGTDLDGSAPDMDGLRAQIHHHLTVHPMRTALEVTRALGLPADRADQVRHHLANMERDGEAQRHAVPREAGRRSALRWTAT